MSDKSQFQLSYAGETPADPPAAVRCHSHVFRPSQQVTFSHQHASRVEFELQIARGGLFSKIGTTWQNVAFHVANHGLSTPQFCLIPFLLD